MSHSHNIAPSPALRAGWPFFLLLFFGITPLYSGVLSLFDPVETVHNHGIRSNIQAFAANDAKALEDLFNDFRGSLHVNKGDYIAVDDLRADAGVAYGEWGYLGYAYRHEVQIRASNDVIELLHLTKNKLDLPPEATYEIDMAIRGFEAHGIVWANRFALLKHEEHHLEFGLGVSLLRGINMQHGTIQGDATITGAKDYDFTASSDYYYTHNYLYDLDVNRPSGWGYTTHVSLHYQYRKGYLSVLGNDVAGKIYWKDLPFSHVDIVSGNKRYDENGYVEYEPTVSGLEKNVDYTQRLPRKWRFEAGYTTPETIHIGGGSDYFERTFFPYLEASAALGGNLTAGFSYETRFDMVGIDIGYKNIALGLKMDSIVSPSAVGLRMNFAADF